MKLLLAIALVLAVPASASAAASWSAGDPQPHPVPFEVLGAASPRAVWLRCERGGHRCVRITSGVFGVAGTHTGFCGGRGFRFGSCYQVSPRDVGHTLRVRVGSVLSAPTGVVRTGEPQ